MSYITQWSEETIARYNQGSKKCPLAARRNRAIFEAVVTLIVEAASKEEESSDILASLSELAVWDDPQKWYEFRSMDAIDVAKEIESRAQYRDRWKKVATAVLTPMYQKIQQQSESVAEPDLEDAYHWIESCQISGSTKQVKWARDIMMRHQVTIALALKNGKSITLDSSWWIDNRADIRL